MARDRLLPFFAATCALTGALHGAIVFLGLPFSLSPGSPVLVLYLAGLAAPAAVAIMLTEPGKRRDFIHSAFRLRGGVKILAVSVFAQAAVLGFAWAMAVAVGEGQNFSLAPSADFWLIALGQVWVAFGEELGWRGFALPRLIDRLGPALATLVLAVIWALWHAPMFFVAGSLQEGTSLVLFAASIICWSSIHTVLYQWARPSCVANMVFHASANMMLNLVHLPETLTPFLVAAYVLIAAMVLGWLVRQTSAMRRAD